MEREEIAASQPARPSSTKHAEVERASRLERRRRKLFSVTSLVSPIELTLSGADDDADVEPNRTMDGSDG